MGQSNTQKPLSSTSLPLHSAAVPVPPTGGEQAAAAAALPPTTDPKRSARVLPCLNSNNCTEGLGSEGQNPRNILRGYDLKKTYAVKCNAEKFIAETGLHRVGFLTLTFPDRLTDHKQASRRWHSLRTHFFPIFGHWQLVKERMVKGYLHFHILLDVKEDIRTGFDFELYQRSVDLRKQRMPYRHLERQAFRTANVQLRNLWATFRQVLPCTGSAGMNCFRSGQRPRPLQNTSENTFPSTWTPVWRKTRGSVPIRVHKARQAFLVALRGIRRAGWNGGASWAPLRIATGALTWTT